jgi:hypothetical protein
MTGGEATLMRFAMVRPRGACKMTTFTKITMTMLAATAGVVGCSKPYENQRPPVDQLDARDRGLQSKDVVEASDRMAMELLAVPEISSTDHRLLVVFTGVRNKTTSVPENLDIFIQRLKASVGKQGRSKLQIIANREEFHDLQSRELEPLMSERDDAAQRAATGNPAARPGQAGLQPDFGLEAVAMDIANRGTNYYTCEFRLIDLRTREQVWTGMYEVRVAK